MSDMMPFILLQEKENKHEITGKSLSVTFDGTTRMGEIFDIVVCFVDPD